MTANQPGTVRFLNPETLHQNPAYSNVVVATGPVTTVYVGGQNAVNQAGEIVGKGDFPAQVRQILRNIEACLNAAGAGFEHLVKLTILVAPGQNLAEGFAVFQEMVPPGNPPIITGAFVAGLAHPDFLAEVDAIAVIPA